MHNRPVEEVLRTVSETGDTPVTGRATMNMIATLKIVVPVPTMLFTVVNVSRRITAHASTLLKTGVAMACTRRRAATTGCKRAETMC